MKILLVDQDVELRLLIAFTLGQSGYECCVAADRTSALQLLELEAPDLALLDHAPLLDGIDLCQELRRRSLRIGSSRPVRLTPLEFTAIHLLLSTPGRTVTAARLLAQL